MKTFRWKNFPKFSGHVNAVLTFLLEPLPKVRTIFAYCQKLFEKLHLLKTLVFHQNVQMQTRGMQFSHPSVRKISTRSSKTTNWMCEINDAETFLSKKIFENFRYTDKCRFVNPAIFFRPKFKKSKKLKLFQKSLDSQILLLGGSDKPAEISCKKIEILPSKIEKKYESTNFSKKVFSQKVSSDM